MCLLVKKVEPVFRSRESDEMMSLIESFKIESDNRFLKFDYSKRSRKRTHKVNKMLDYGLKRWQE